MQPKDGANGIKLPGRLSLNLSLLFTSFYPEVQPCKPRLPVLPLAALSLPSVTPLVGDTQKTFVSSNSNRQPQPANLRVKSRMVGGVKKGKLGRQRSVTACSLSCWFYIKRTGLMMMTMVVATE